MLSAGSWVGNAEEIIDCAHDWFTPRSLHIIIAAINIQVIRL